MTQTTFASNATPSQTLLDQNFTQLYDLRELISTPSYTASTPKATFDGSWNLALIGNLTSSGTVNGNSLAAGGTKITQPIFISGNVTAATTVPINSSSQLGGVILLIRGADGAGIAFARIYLIALRVSAGAAPDVSTSVLVSTAGSTAPTFTFSNVAGFLNVTAATNNSAYVSSFGG